MLQGYVDDRFGPTAQWDWGDTTGETDANNEIDDEVTGTLVI